jgi:hypothetical protein
MNYIAPISALVMALGLLGLQIVLGLEATVGGSLGTQASMIAAMATLAVLPVFIEAARRSGHGFIACCLGVSFLSFLAYSLPATTGRTGEIKETKVTAAADLELVRAELTSITQTLGWARPDKLSECAGAPDPLPPNGWPRCRQKTGTVAALEDRQSKLEAQMKASATARLGDMGSDIWAWALSWLGMTAAIIRKGSVLAFAIGLDFAIWSLVAFTTHAWPRGITETTPSKDLDREIEEYKRITSNDTEPLPPTKAIVPDPKGSNIIPWVQRFEIEHGRKPRLDEAEAAFPEVARSTCYRRLKAA